MKNNLEEYPVLTDPELDFEATKQHFGTGSCIHSSNQLQTKSGETIVYMLQQKEGDERVFNERNYIGRKCIHGIIVAGYLSKPKGLFSFFKKDKVRTIPKKEREQAILELTKKVKKSYHSYIEFWD